MNQLNRQEGLIFDFIRKKWLSETKEEIVRQLVLIHLTGTLGYGSGRIAVEKQIIVSGRRKRFDVVIYDELANPFILIECKSFDIKLDQKNFYQVSRYNLALMAPYLCITNGLQSIVARIDFNKMKIDYQEDLPPKF